MSDAFRCDGCDEFYSGEAAVYVDLETGGAIGITDVRLGHDAGRDDPDPAEAPFRRVDWPPHKSDVEFCVVCAVDGGLMDAFRDVLDGGRYG